MPESVKEDVGPVDARRHEEEDTGPVNARSRQNAERAIEEDTYCRDNMGAQKRVPGSPGKEDTGSVDAETLEEEDARPMDAESREEEDEGPKDIES
ncbi:hypothetical protein NDU88_002940 [Pleurodeles waltl]|uniref:Uncharacterized protein n=1 Tax=Pleurodeles waltl TaxID=8319 RepID=A0AAV7WQZ0_PLEWA|nr:hypothetical protein NDU88_002940 [Pleurodeles waltl]